MYTPVSDPVHQAQADAAQAKWQTAAEGLADIGLSEEAVFALTGKVASPPLGLRFARSANRVNEGQLDGAVLDVGSLYAVFVPNYGNITQVVFKLDGSPVHTEFSAPWDYDGTAFGGSANRVTFTAGSHEIEATVTTASGVVVVTAAFEVE